jgi:hypothetical protein
MRALAESFSLTVAKMVDAGMELVHYNVIMLVVFRWSLSTDGQIDYTGGKALVTRRIEATALKFQQTTAAQNAYFLEIRIIVRS